MTAYPHHSRQYLAGVDEDCPIPDRLHAVVETAVELIMDGRREALASNERVIFLGPDPLLWLREGAVELVPLPDEAWASSIAGPVDQRPGTWWLAVDLWGPDGRTDYSLEGTAVEGPDGIRLTVSDIHVM